MSPATPLASALAKLIESMPSAVNPWLAAMPLAYLLGSVPFGYLLVRTFRKQDIRSLGSRNIGATNVARSGAKGLGLATLLLDCAKGSAAVLLAFQIARHTALTRPAAYDLAAAAAIAAVLGHVFPLWLSFRGGKGVATALGVFLVLAPLTIAVAVLIFAAVFALTRYVSLASIVSAASIPLSAGMLLSARSPLVLAAFLGIPLLVIAKHHSNISRLLAGTESRFGTARKVRA